MKLRSDRLVALLLLIAAAALLLAALYQNTRAAEPPQVYNVSVLVYASGDRFMKGLEQAAVDLNVDLRIATGYTAHDGTRQLEYLRRELENQADAVVIYAEDSAAVTSYLNSRQLPVLVTYGLPLETLTTIHPHVGADDLALGRRLGEQIAANDSAFCQILLPLYSNASHSRRLEGIKAVLSEHQIPFSVRFHETPLEYLSSAETGRTAIAALDPELLVPMCETAPLGAMLFGIGFVDEAKAPLANGRLTGLVVYSEFEAGHLCLAAAIETVKTGTAIDRQLEIYDVTAAEMYQEPLVHVLFPIGLAVHY